MSPCFFSYDANVHINEEALEIVIPAEEPILQAPKPKQIAAAPSPGAAQTPREIADRLFGPVNWTTDTEGLCTCPGISAHTGANKPTDCRIKLDTEGGHVPTITCFHNSCAGIIDSAKYRLRSEIGKAKFAVERRGPPRQISNGEPLPEEPSETYNAPLFPLEVDPPGEARMSEEAAIIAAAVPGPLLTAQVLPDRKSIIGSFLRTGDSGFFFAKRGVGKTLMALEISRLAVQGGRLRNWYSDGGNKVVYLDCEMPWDDMIRRATGFGLTTSENFILINHELLWHTSHRVINLALPGQQKAITSYLESVGQTFILDNLSTGVSKRDENKSMDWETIGNWLLDLRRRHISCLILHHAGRNNEMRGTTKREDAASFILRLDDDAAKERQGESSMIAMFTKFRSRNPDEAKPFAIRFVNDGPRIIAETSDADGMEVVIQWVRDGLTSPSDIAVEMGLSKGTVSKLASRAIGLGRLAKKGRDYYEPDQIP